MSPRARAAAGALLAAPLVALGLWLASGREVLTKPARAVQVTVRDELFGDSTTQVRLESGPVFGYFVGLDVVAATLGAALIVGAIWFSLARRRRMAPQQGDAP